MCQPNLFERPRWYAYNVCVLINLLFKMYCIMSQLMLVWNGFKWTWKLLNYAQCRQLAWECPAS